MPTIVTSIHRDLKPDVSSYPILVQISSNWGTERYTLIQNCLFLADGTMKLADFGLARMYGTPKTRLSPEPITLWYK